MSVVSAISLATTATTAAATITATTLEARVKLKVLWATTTGVITTTTTTTTTTITTTKVLQNQTKISPRVDDAVVLLPEGKEHPLVAKGMKNKISEPSKPEKTYWKEIVVQHVSVGNEKKNVYISWRKELND